ncbi:MAG: sigma-70 family RNA polymerase sigma factor [Chthonomonadales bacterium]|nr:sigma-70 family RNA polymerase sigma factor [Chthonomonadales bacterium]
MPDPYESARLGDREALSAIVESLRPRVSRMARHYARRTGQDADDLLQEAWLGLLDAMPQMDIRIGSPRQYLLSRARWRLLDAVRRERLRRCLPLDEPSCSELPSADPCGVGDLAVGEFLGRLQPGQRTIARLLMEGHSWRETGARIGCTSANVAYHVRRIREAYVRREECAAP